MTTETTEKTKKPEVNLEYKRGYDDGRRHRDIQFSEALKVLKSKRKLHHGVWILNADWIDEIFGSLLK
jgi:hypothetical protein